MAASCCFPCLAKYLIWRKAHLAHLTPCWWDRTFSRDWWPSKCDMLRAHLNDGPQRLLKRNSRWIFLFLGSGDALFRELGTGKGDRWSTRFWLSNYMQERICELQNTSSCFYFTQVSHYHSPTIRSIYNIVSGQTKDLSLLCSKTWLHQRLSNLSFFCIGSASLALR